MAKKKDTRKAFINNDKIKHFLAGVILCFLFGYWSIAIMLVKEILWDWALKKGTPDWMDFIAGEVGINLAFIIKGGLGW